MRFAHCSDVHITEDYFALPLHRLGWRRWVALAELTVGGRAKRYARAPHALSAIVRDAQAHRADHFILSGDLTAYALEGEFSGARKALGPLADDPRRCTVIPGNHDVFTPGSHRSGRFARHFGHLLESDLPEYRREGAFPFVRLLGDEAAVVGLLSARVPASPGLSFGTIGPAQLEGLAALLRDSRLDGRAVLVRGAPRAAHPEGRADRWHHGLRDADALLRLLPGPASPCCTATSTSATTIPPPRRGPTSSAPAPPPRPATRATGSSRWPGARSWAASPTRPPCDSTARRR
ncbi:metallophosphoesterase family protein [Pyxidicoccus sp. 3LG]